MVVGVVRDRKLDRLLHMWGAAKIRHSRTERAEDWLLADILSARVHQRRKELAKEKQEAELTNIQCAHNHTFTGRDGITYCHECKSYPKDLNTRALKQDA